MRKCGHEDEQRRGEEMRRDEGGHERETKDGQEDIKGEEGKGRGKGMERTKERKGKGEGRNTSEEPTDSFSLSLCLISLFVTVVKCDKRENIMPALFFLLGPKSTQLSF